MLFFVLYFAIYIGTYLQIIFFESHKMRSYNFIRDLRLILNYKDLMVSIFFSIVFSMLFSFYNIFWLVYIFFIIYISAIFFYSFKRIRKILNIKK